MSITVYENTDNPTEVWNQLSKITVVKNIERPLHFEENVTKKRLRIVCMSDTHAKTSLINFDIPYGDVFIHAGDFTNEGTPEEVSEFNDWIGKLPHRYKIIIAGNHERTFDYRKDNNGSCSSIKNLLTNCIYLEDSSVIIDSVKIYGTPWNPVFDKISAFKISRGICCLEKWNMIPNDTNILITHCPPLGYNDLCTDGLRAGCAELLSTVQQRVKPEYHIFGHIHEGYGIKTDGKTIYINASACTKDCIPMNKPVIFDIPISE